jgi:hypothetical protein
VYHNHNSAIEVGGQLGANALQSLNAAGGGADHDKLAVKHQELDVLSGLGIAAATAAAVRIGQQ